MNFTIEGSSPKNWWEEIPAAMWENLPTDMFEVGIVQPSDSGLAIKRVTEAVDDLAKGLFEDVLPRITDEAEIDKREVPAAAETTSSKKRVEKSTIGEASSDKEVSKSRKAEEDTEYEPKRSRRSKAKSESAPKKRNRKYSERNEYAIEINEDTKFVIPEHLNLVKNYQKEFEGKLTAPDKKETERLRRQQNKDIMIYALSELDRVSKINERLMIENAALRERLQKWERL